ncbi:hypothetical protein IFT48_04670 [Pseudomonas fluorescens]|uniref:hypothetical protein n=1 Tax=Pseudomonas fluorescens TaxID=294 RepID=UPI001930AA66|nr:hypothetical protein [Pseudomonas fluorescens]MBD8089267.1 hypothetical protein [Pseudomonas fluorescens]
MSDTTANSNWEVPKSYDVGVDYYHRNLLKGNQVVERYFKQWLARIDKSNIESFYDYETDELKRSVKNGHPCEIHYDQIQRMVRGANLPLDIEKQIFYHLDYMDNKGIIDIRRVKEYFAYAGIEGVYDLESGRHFQIPYDPPFAVDSLYMERWKDKDREEMARMMAAPGEVPQYDEDIEKLEATISTMMFESMAETGLLEKLEAEGKNIGMEVGDTLEEMEEKSRRHSEETPGFKQYDNDLQALTSQFEKRQDVIDMRSEIQNLKVDETEKLALALKKYVPDEPQNLSEISPEITKDWDYAFEHAVGDTDRWAKAFFDGKDPGDFPNHEPDAEELKLLDPVLVEQGRFDMARYKNAYKDFEVKYVREIRVRNAAFKDWILQDFILSPINRGELAKVRRLDMPRDFANAVRSEMQDGLMEKIKAPTRIERIQDDSGRYTLILNEKQVGSFHPQEVMHMATDKNQAPEEVDENKKKKTEEDLAAERDAASAAMLDGLDEDADAYIPNEPPPAERKAEKLNEQIKETAPKGDKPSQSSAANPGSPGQQPGARQFAPGASKSDPAANRPSGDPRAGNPGMGGFPPGMGMPGMGGGMGGMGGMRPGMGGMPPPLFNFNASLPKLSLKGLSLPSIPFRSNFNADSMASSISLKSQAIGTLGNMLKSGETADGAPLSAEQTLGAWGEMANAMKSLNEDIQKTGKAGDKKLNPVLGEAVKGAKKMLDETKPFVDDKAGEPGAVGESARKVKQEMDKIAKMLMELVKAILKLFSRRREPEDAPAP